MTDGENILSAVDQVLAGKDLQAQPRALLILRLCQFALLYAPDKAEHYWEMLQPLMGKLPAEFKEETIILRTTLEESSSSGAKGFTAEMLAEVASAQALVETDLAAAEQGLAACETKLNKRFLPMGKGPVWAALVEAWMAIDRSEALRLLKNVSGDLRINFLTRMNKSLPLSAEEWDILESAIGMGKVEELARKLLEDEGQVLDLSQKVLQHVAKRMRDKVTEVGGQGDEAGMVNALGYYGRLLALHCNGEQAEQVPELLREVFVQVARATWLDRNWMTRFTLLQAILQMSSGWKVNDGDVLTEAYVESLAAKAPAHMVNFVWAHWAALMTTAAGAEAAYSALMARTGQDKNAEAWFLIKLVERKMGSEAMALGERSPNAASLLPRLRRAWLCTNPQEARAVISPQDMAGDPIGEFLAQGSHAQRGAYLKRVTQDGERAVPGAMWAGAGTEDQAEGLRGFWAQAKAKRKSMDETLSEYLALNPLYSSYKRDTKVGEQFGDMVRVNGYGDYRFQDVDSALLAALVAWGDEEPQQARAALRSMWQAIQPDEQILMLDWLRNAVLSRCVNVFAADAQVLIEDYLAWFKRELVQKGRQWQFGNQTVTLKYPPTALLQFCVVAASNVSAFSPARRDEILLTALERFEANPELVEAAAQLYNSDKAPLELAPPLQLRSNLLPAWQTGVVKNALVAILQAWAAQVVAQAG